LRERLGARVARAEALIEGGDWHAGFDAYRLIVQEEFLSGDGTPSANQLLVVDRFGDLAPMLGLTSIALDVYPKAIADGAPAIRIPALAKMLQLASNTGAPCAVRAFRQLEQTLWNGEMPDALTAGAFGRARLGGRTEALICLALGCFFNCTRRLPESGAWLERGIRLSGGADRGGALPLRLTLANHYVTLGLLEKAEAELRNARIEVASETGGEAYRMWLEDAAARTCLMRGRIAEALGRMEALEATARERRVWGTVCRTLLARAEAMILLNQLDRADACIEESDALPPGVWTEDLRAERQRVVRYRGLRAGLFVYLDAGPSAAQMQAEMQDDGPRTAKPAKTVPGIDPTEQLVWTGDVLRDYLLREAQVLEALDLAARSGSRQPDNHQLKTRVQTALEDLEGDFGHLPSPLVRGRIRLTAGIIRQATGGNGVADLMEARRIFAELGAEQFLWHATDHLMAARPELRDSLLDENDRRLDMLSSQLGANERNFFELNKYRAREWQWRSRIDQVVKLRAGAGDGWVSGTKARLAYLIALHRLVRDLDEEKLRRRIGYQGRKQGRPWMQLIGTLLFRGMTDLTVGYLVLPDLTFVYWSRWGRLDCAVLAMGRLQVENLARALHSALIEEEARFRPAASRACRDLGLQTILAAAPPRIKRLTLVTDEMATLPFSALRVSAPRVKKAGGESQYVAERFAVRISEVGEEPPELRHPVRQGAVRVRQGAVSAFYNGGLSGDPRLHKANVCAESAAGWFRQRWGSEVKVTAEREECLAELPGAAAFFYFGHGEFGHPGAESGLGFASVDGKRMLSQGQLDPLDFSGMEQVSIFSCHGGDSFAVRGRWTTGLPQMLLRRGARSVIASIWQADEEVAAKLAESFPERARKAGRAVALQEFQKAKIAARNLHSHPIFWAAFQIYGDGSALRPPRGRRPWQPMNQR
jgi:hypothetical protein